MQPVLMVTSAVPGLLLINGQPAGELRSDAPVARPVGPQGGVYVQLFPTVPGYLPLTRRITLSAGKVIAESFLQEEGMRSVVWPGGAIDMELFPEKINQMEKASFSPMDEPGAVRQDDGSVRVLIPMGDVARHMLLVSYVFADGQWTPQQWEVMWENGGPSWPNTPEQTALALVQACLLGLEDEARGYLAPGAHLPQLYDACACLPMTYPVPGASPCIGLVHTLGRCLAQVYPMYYRAVASVGMQGGWQLDDLWTEVPDT